MKNTLLGFSLILLFATSVISKNKIVKRVLLAAGLCMAIVATTGALDHL